MSRRNVEYNETKLEDIEKSSLLIYGMEGIYEDIQREEERKINAKADANARTGRDEYLRRHANTNETEASTFLIILIICLIAFIIWLALK